MAQNNQLTIYALVGSSGSGKSHRALKIANRYNIDLIVDDGLIIKNSQILAGKTAKRQPTRIGAIKVALFVDPQEAQKAQEAIQKAQVASILILGTSKGMVDKIAKTLKLPPIDRYLLIEDVSTQQEIEIAKNMRNQHASHVIPAPTVEVKKSFPETWVDPFKILLRHNRNTADYGVKSWQEQSIVRPTFTSYGHISISHSALTSIVALATSEIPEVKKCHRIHLEKMEGKVAINLQVTLPYGQNLVALVQQIQTKINYMVGFMTSLLVEHIDVTVDGLYFPPKQ